MDPVSVSFFEMPSEPQCPEGTVRVDGEDSIAPDEPRLLAEAVLPTDPMFDLTADLAALHRDSIRQLVPAAVRRRKELWPVLVGVRSLPHLTIPFSDTPAGRDLTHLLRRGRRHAVAVLEIPSEAGAYSKGRSRRSMRYNIKKALAEGVSCATLAGPDVSRRFAEVIVSGWGVDATSRTFRRWTRNVADEPHARYFAALGADGTALVFAKIFVSGDHARLHTFIQNQTDSASPSSSARFLLAEYLVESMRTENVRYLVTDSILGLPRGLRYYQQLVGYVVYNVALGPEHAGIVGLLSS